MNTAQILSRDDIMREWREGLTQQLGSEVLADAHIRFAMEEAAKMRARHADLRAELQRLDTGLAEHHTQTRMQMAPLREAADHLLSESNAAFVRLENARIQREADCAAKFRNRMNVIREELGRPYSPIGPKEGNWKHGPTLDVQQRSN